MHEGRKRERPDGSGLQREQPGRGARQRWRDACGVRESVVVVRQVLQLLDRKWSEPASLDDSFDLRPRPSLEPPLPLNHHRPTHSSYRPCPVSNEQAYELSAGS